MTDKKQEITYIQLDKIKTDLWDARNNRTQNQLKIEDLKRSIDTGGLINPLLVTKADKDGYHSVIAGRRRLRALKELGKTIIPCIITNETKASKIKSLTMAENLIREDLTDPERIGGILAIFQGSGFTKKEIMYYAKSYHNNRQTNLVPNDFKEIIDTIAYSPNFIYQLMQIATLTPKIFNYAEKKKLTTNQKLLLATGILRDHPELQIKLINTIAGRPNAESTIEQRQLIHDIQTGAIQKKGNTYRYYDHLHEKIDTERPELEMRSSRAYIDIIRNTNKLLYLLTGHQIAGHGHYEYETKNVEYTKEHRKMFLQNLRIEHLLTLERNLEVLYLGVRDILELIDQKLVKENKAN